jgi:hypothetical protein
MPKNITVNKCEVEDRSAEHFQNMHDLHFVKNERVQQMNSTVLHSQVAL